MEADEWLVSCRCESAKAVTTLLSCLRHVATGATTGESTKATDLTQTRRKSSSSSSAIQPVTVFCSPTSLTFHVHGKGKQTQASVDMQASLFSQYHVAQPEETGEETPQDWQAGGEFCVNLSTVLECLHVLGAQSLERTKLCFSYNITKDIFKIELLEESGILSTAAIPGMIPPEDDIGNSLALAFRSSPITARIIIKSETLKEVVQELELVSGATTGTVFLGSGGLEMAAVGHLGECLGVDSGQRLARSFFGSRSDESTECVRAHLSTTHAVGKYAGLDIAQETCITINNNGMMAIQHQVIDAQVSENPSFVDFIMCCLEDEDDGQDTEPRSPSMATAQDSPSQCSRTQTQHRSSPGSTVYTQTNRSQATRSHALANSGYPSSRHDDTDTEDKDDQICSRLRQHLFLVHW
jgi:hypothetical protein